MNFSEKMKRNGNKQPVESNNADALLERIKQVSSGEAESVGNDFEEYLNHPIHTSGAEILEISEIYLETFENVLTELKMPKYLVDMTAGSISDAVITILVELMKREEER